MMIRNLFIALLASLAVHILWMSAIAITVPEDFHRVRTYTRIDFLGPILQKTAFDMALESAAFSGAGDHDRNAPVPECEKDLMVTPIVRYSDPGLYPGGPAVAKDRTVTDFLMGAKSVPDLMLDPKSPDSTGYVWSGTAQDGEEGRIGPKTGGPEK